jgi:hypothetical protein
VRRVYVGGAFASIAAIIATWAAIGVGGGTGGSGSGVSACPAPRFPDATCTGVPAGTILTAYTGPNPIVADDTVIDGKIISEAIEVRASNVTIRNSRTHGIIFGDGPESFGKQPLRVEDVDVTCDHAWDTGFSGANMIIRRMHLKGCTNGFSIDQNIDVRDSFVEYIMSAQLLIDEPDAHDDGIQFGCGHYAPTFTGTSCAAGYAPGVQNVSFVHNTIFGINEDGSFTTSGFIMNPPSPPASGPGDGQGIDSNILIQGNLLAGGGYTIYCPGTPDPGPDVAADHNLRIIGNHFSTRFKSTVGFFAPTDGACANEADVSGNVYHESGLPITLQ